MACRKVGVSGPRALAPRGPMIGALGNECRGRRRTFKSGSARGRSPPADAHPASCTYLRLLCCSSATARRGPGVARRRLGPAPRCSRCSLVFARRRRPLRDPDALGHLRQRLDAGVHPRRGALRPGRRPPRSARRGASSSGARRGTSGIGTRRLRCRVHPRRRSRGARRPHGPRPRPRTGWRSWRWSAASTCSPRPQLRARRGLHAHAARPQLLDELAATWRPLRQLAARPRAGTAVLAYAYLRDRLRGHRLRRRARRDLQPPPARPHGGRAPARRGPRSATRSSPRPTSACAARTSARCARSCARSTCTTG